MKYLSLIVIVFGAVFFGCGGGGGTAVVIPPAPCSTESSTVGTTRLAGQVTIQGTTVGIGAVVVQIFASGTLVAEATTCADGRFNIAIPTSATEFSLTPSTIPATFYRIYEYAGLRYLPGVSTCRTRLPVIPSGVTTSLPSRINLPATTTPPPPPPNGCS